MKTIKLKAYKETIEVNGQEHNTIFTTYSLLRTVVNNTEKGIRVEDMMQRIKILDILDVFKDEFVTPETLDKLPGGFLEKEIDVKFEDADFAVIKHCFVNMVWSVNSKAIIDTYKALLN